jgi:MFS family permease
MRRFSIRTLMAFVLVSAIGLAALRNANDLWAGMLLLLALAAVGAAMMGAVILRGRERYWWAGFAFFGGGYLAFAVGPWLSDTFQPQLGTTLSLDHLRKLMFASGAPALRDAEAESLLLEEQKLEAALANVKRLTRNFNFDPSVMILTRQLLATQAKLTANKNAGPRYEHFQSVGHSLFALLAGLVGAMIAVWFYARRELDEAAAGQA